MLYLHVIPSIASCVGNLVACRILGGIRFNQSVSSIGGVEAIEVIELLLEYLWLCSASCNLHPSMSNKCYRYHRWCWMEV